jgi:hypothetical protein
MSPKPDAGAENPAFCSNATVISRNIRVFAATVAVTPQRKKNLSRAPNGALKN